MVDSSSEISDDGSDYDLIERAVAETERGRRFLAEYVRRNRGADTEALLQAIRRLEKVVKRDLSGSSEEANSESGSPNGELLFAVEDLVSEVTQAGAAILGAAEAIQEAAWGLRERGSEGVFCDVLDRRAIEIYEACSNQDDAVHRIAALIGMPKADRQIPIQPVGEPSTPAPPPLPADTADDELDFLPSAPESGPAKEAPELAPEIKPEPEPGSSPTNAAERASEDLALAFSDLDRLSIEEKIALFS